MKLLIISPSFYPAVYYGGPIFSLLSLAKYLARNGLQVFVSTTNCNGLNKLNVEVNKYLELEKNLYIKYYSGGTLNGFSFKMYLCLYKDFSNKDFIYLVSVFSPSVPLALLMNIVYRKPLIISPRGQLGEWCLKQGNILKKTWLKVFLSPVANKIYWEATSLSEKEMILKIYPRAKVEVIPAIINVEDYLGEDKRIKGKDKSDEGENGKSKKEVVRKDYTIYEKLTGKNFNGKLIIVTMGRLHKVKGFDILISSMSKVQGQDLVLLIAGEDFGEKKKLEMLIDKLGLKEKVFLTGMIEGLEKIEFLRNADVFALASHHENFGMVYAEALAAGTPVIASKNTPWQDVEKYNCGRWVENTPQKFATAIDELLSMDLLQMGLNGQKYIEDNFSSEIVITKYKSLFNKMLKQ